MADKGKLRAESYLAPETLAQLSPFELRARMIVEGLRSGTHSSPHLGMSVEFEQHRQYVPGDDLRHLDWKVYGRSDRLTIKQYEQETTLDVILLVDCSASMRYGSLRVKKGWGGTGASRETGTWTKYDHAVATATALAWMSLQQSDRVGLALFADGVRKTMARSSSRGQWRQLVSMLSGQPVAESTDIIKSTDQVLSTVSNRSMFIIISDFLQDPADIRSAVARFRHRRHDVICLNILDLQEMEFNLDDPAPFIGLEGEGRIRIDPRSIRDAYLESLHDHVDQLSGYLMDFGFDYHLMNSHESIGPALAYLIARRTAWLKQHHAH